MALSCNDNIVVAGFQEAELGVNFRIIYTNDLT